MGTWIKTDGTVTQVTPIKGKKFTLAELQVFVGGYIEHVRTRKPKPRNMWINEEGLIVGLPINRKASELIDPMYNTAGGVRGNVIVTEPGEA